MISSVEVEWLEREFTKEEVLNSIASMEGEKTLLPYGFPVVIYRKCGGFKKKDIMNVVRELHDNEFVSWRLNNTFIFIVLKI